METGTFILVVGPSGAGKDTLLDGARATLKDDHRFVFARRSITRPAGSGGEDHDALTPDEFAQRKQTGDFLLTWSAHGLEYGLPASLAADLAKGRTVVANGSRAAIADLAARLPHLVIVEITAPPAIIAARLEQRRRETAEQIAERLTRKTPPLPPHLKVIRVVNDADVKTGVSRLVAALCR